MKLLFIFTFLFFTNLLYGQHYLPIQHDSILTIGIKKKGNIIEKTKRNEFILTGIADYSGTSLGKDIVQKFLYGGDISDAMKLRSLNRHRAINRFGADIQSELEFKNYHVNLFKHKNWGLIYKVGIYNFLQAIYSKDLFTFPMYGNSYFAGDTAKFSGSKFSNLTYQKLGIGWLDKKSKSSICLNLFGLTNFASLNLIDGEIFQNTAMDSISINYQGKANFSESDLYFKGIGFGIDADFRWRAKNIKGNPNFQVLLRNLGVISQTTKMNTYNADTTISFSGFSFDQLINGTYFQSDQSNILDTIGVNNTMTKSTIFLPGVLQISKLVDESFGEKSKKIQEFYGARIYLSQMAIPLIFAGLDYDPFKGLVHFGASVSYGGFAKLRGGFYSNVKLNNLNIGVGSENLFNPTGQSIIFRLQCVF
jgi:hypothetical protein